MIAQRAAGAAPVVQASAEDLPFDDDSFDAAMAMITVHHWRDLGGRRGGDGRASPASASSSSPSTRGRSRASG